MTIVAIYEKNATRSGLAASGSVCFLSERSFLAFCDSVVGANLRTASTTDASIRIDVVDITGRDSLNRANRFTSAACNAVIANYVSHS